MTLIITLEITDPETVAAYKDVDKDIIYDDLWRGTLMDEARVVSVENKENC